MPRIVIIGAGLAGLSAGYHANLRRVDCVTFEQDTRVGGLCKTIEKDGFLFDYSGHLLHLKTEHCKSLVKNLLGENLNVVKRNAAIYSNGILTPYPYQVNLYGLPASVIKDCLLEFVKAHYASDDVSTATYKNFHDWIVGKLGKGIGRHFMFPYNEKLWTARADELTCEWLSEYVPSPSLEEVFDGAFGQSKKDFGYNAVFWYPKKGGIQALCDAMAESSDNIVLEEKLARISPLTRSLEFESGLSVTYEKLISTIPLDMFVRLLGSDAPDRVRKAGQKLRHNSVLILNFGIRGEGFTDKHWVYIPEKKYMPYRVGVYSNFSQHMAPPGMTSYYVETAYRAQEGVDEGEVGEKCVGLLNEMGFISSAADVLVKESLDVRHAYVIYDRNYAENRALILEYLNEMGIHSIGRYGRWEYSAMEEAMFQGKQAVDEAVPEKYGAGATLGP